MSDFSSLIDAPLENPREIFVDFDNSIIYNLPLTINFRSEVKSLRVILFLFLKVRVFSISPKLKV